MIPTGTTRWKRGVGLLVLLAFLLVIADWAVWTWRDHVFATKLRELGLRYVGSIFDWPVGKEYRIVAPVELNADQWGSLEESLDARPRHTTVMFRFEQGLSDERRRELTRHQYVIVVRDPPGDP